MLKIKKLKGHFQIVYTKKCIIYLLLKKKKREKKRKRNRVKESRTHTAGGFGSI
jgi:hypothetical protein